MMLTTRRRDGQGDTGDAATVAEAHGGGGAAVHGNSTVAGVVDRRTKLTRRDRSLGVASLVRPWIVLTDLEALAAQYPSVQADLAAAGLSAAEAEAYRLAVISFRVGKTLDQAARGPIDPASVQGKNRRFYQQHATLLQGDTLGGGLQAMWWTP